MDIPDFFAIDIGNHSLKVAEVKRKGNQAHLLHIGGSHTELNLLENTSDDSMLKLAEQLKSAKKAAGINTNNCVAAVPETPIFSRLLSIPKVAADKLEESIHWELKPLIPVPLEEVDVAFLEIGERVVGSQQVVDAYVVACPKSLTARYRRLCQMAGLELLALETEALANSRVVKFNMQPERDMMVLDMGAMSSDLIVARDGVPVFAQSISTGSDALTKAIAADYGINLEEAEKYKRAFGLNSNAGEGKITKSIEPIMQIIINEMSRTLTYYKEKVADSDAQELYLCGEAVLLPGLVEYLHDKLNLKTRLVDPIAQMKVDAAAKEQLEQLKVVGYSVAIGLGLKDS